ncbi:hypothetical protein OC846_006906 [Tilletia horrida]|uniref:Uncharacterized protein n=1 Tax=Tilletia horrida TaxID=155126 RepID=A0AAN6GJ35_9BASI|nr:hypothetical protein OC846_006906 [Tilletia horrida]
MSPSSRPRKSERLAARKDPEAGPSTQREEARGGSSASRKRPASRDPSPAASGVSSKAAGKKRARSTSPGRLSPLAATAEQEAQRKAAHRAVRQGASSELVPFSDDEKYKLKYHSNTDVSPSQLETALKAMALPDFTTARHLPHKSGHKEAAGPRQRAGYLFFTSAEGARSALDSITADTDIDGHRLTLEFASSNFDHLASIPPRRTIPALVTAEKASRPTAVESTIFIDKLPRKWNFGRVEQVFDPHPPGQSHVRAMQCDPVQATDEDPDAPRRFNRWWIRFKTAEQAVECLLRFRDQVVANVRWATADIDLSVAA